MATRELYDRERKAGEKLVVYLKRRDFGGKQRETKLKVKYR